MRRFRLGTTSFVYPDRLGANVERLRGRVDDVEILLFDLDDPRGLPEPGELESLPGGGLTFTVHTPLAASLASADEERRRRGVALCERAIAMTAELEPLAYTVHVYLGDREGDQRPADLAAWRRQAARSLEALLLRGLVPGRLCVECLDYDFALIDPVVQDLGLGVALDLGHVARDGGDPLAALARYLDRARVVQWHGVEPGGRDHRSLVHFGQDRARAVLDALSGWDGVLTLEVFRERDFEESLALVRRLLGEAP